MTTKRNAVGKNINSKKGNTGAKKGNEDWSKDVINLVNKHGKSSNMASDLPKRRNNVEQVKSKPMVSKERVSKKSASNATKVRKPSSSMYGKKQKPKYGVMKIIKCFVKAVSSSFKQRKSKNKKKVNYFPHIVLLLFAVSFGIAIVALILSLGNSTKIVELGDEVSRIEVEVSQTASDVKKGNNDSSVVKSGSNSSSFSSERKDDTDMLEYLCRVKWKAVDENLTREEKLLFLEILAGEAVGEPTDGRQATANAIVNAINIHSDDSARDTLLYKDRYSCIENGIVYLAGNPVNEEFLKANSDLLLDVEPILTGKVDPILPDSYWHYLATKISNNMSPEEFQEKLHIEAESVVYGNHIFYPESIWEKVNMVVMEG